MASTAASVIFLFAHLLLMSATTANTSNYAESVDVFSGRFYKEVSQQPDNKDKNVIMSGLSADMVMSMVALGAQGQTGKEITDALDIENIVTITPQIKKLIEDVNNVKGVDLHLANRVYARAAADGKLDSVNSGYKSRIEDVFKSEVQQLDFSQNVAAAKEINGWVEKETNDKIKDLISPESLSSLTAAVLVNAIYFKGNWDKKFDARFTRKDNFTLTDGSQVVVDMMSKQDKFLYKESPELDAKILVLPYEKGEVSMVIILPNKVNGINELENKLSGGTSKYLDNLNEAEINIKLPKFVIKTSIDMKDVFQKLGTNRVFSPQAELRGIMSDGPELYVSEAIQKAFIEVNEEGAEAAAASGVVVSFESLVVLFYSELICNHPFYFIIKTGDTELFSGAYHGQ